MDKQFSYRAKDRQGETVTGTLTAQSPKEVALILQTKNLLALEIREKKKTEEIFKKEFNIRIRSVNGESFGRFCRQFEIMLKAGIPILKCLELIAAETENQQFARDIHGVGQQIQCGASLSQALMAYPKSFPVLFVFMVEAGEISGNLSTCLLYTSPSPRD